MTKPDLQNEQSCKNLRGTLSELVQLNIIPIINANDAVAPPPEPDKDLAGVCKRSRYNNQGHRNRRRGRVNVVVK